MTGWSPRSASRRTSCRPIRPVPPVMNTRMIDAPRCVNPDRRPRSDEIACARPSCSSATRDRQAGGLAGLSRAWPTSRIYSRPRFGIGWPCSEGMVLSYDVNGTASGDRRFVRTDLPFRQSRVASHGTREFLHPMNPNVRKLFDLHRLHAYKRPPRWSWSTVWPSSRRAGSPTGPTGRGISTSRFPRSSSTTATRSTSTSTTGGEVTVDYLADRLADYLDEYVQRPPYNLVGSSLGGQVILTYAARHPEKVGEARPDLPLGLPRRREPADDGGGPAEPVRHAGQVGLPPLPFRQRRAGRGRSSGSSRTGSGRRGSCGRSAGPSATRSPRS